MSAGEPIAPTRLALVGAGRFGAFLAEAVAAVPECECVAVADVDPSAAHDVASAVGGEAIDLGELDALLASGRVDALVVATPPATHADLVRRALHAGLDVFVEKPVATDLDEAEELAALAEQHDRVVVVDHVLRYNPLLRALRRIQEQMGWQVTRFLFDNDAADESLGADHWFWDEAVSGGIFVEHGVHFFDAATLFVDEPAEQVSAVSASRTDGGPPDLVSATVRHGSALATHTHSFTHAHRAERQWMRIDFGPAEAMVRGWIPVEAQLIALTDDAGADRLRGLLVQAGRTRFATGCEELSLATAFEVEDVDGEPVATGRGHRFPASRRCVARLDLGGEAAKSAVYRGSVMAAFADLHACRTEPGRAPISGARTAVEALRVAHHAREAARTGVTTTIRRPAHRPLEMRGTPS